MADVKPLVALATQAPYEALAIRLLDLAILLIEKAPPEAVERLWDGYVRRAEKLEEFWERLTTRLDQKEKGRS